MQRQSYNYKRVPAQIAVEMKHFLLTCVSLKKLFVRFQVPYACFNPTRFDAFTLAGTLVHDNLRYWISLSILMLFHPYFVRISYLCQAI